VHGDVAFNTADIDGDGRTEILVTRDFEILILDGATGQIKRRAPTPRSFKGKEDHYPQTVGDSILVCNLRGLDGPRDLILKDRYCNMWAYTADLDPLCTAASTRAITRAPGHQRRRRDEVMAGTACWTRRHTMWTVPGSDPDHNRYPGSSIAIPS